MYADFFSPAPLAPQTVGNFSVFLHADVIAHVGTTTTLRTSPPPQSPITNHHHLPTVIYRHSAGPIHKEEFAQFVQETVSLPPGVPPMSSSCLAHLPSGVAPRSVLSTTMPLSELKLPRRDGARPHCSLKFHRASLIPVCSGKVQAPMGRKFHQRPEASRLVQYLHWKTCAVKRRSACTRSSLIRFVAADMMTITGQSR
ncbi:hypothetical protein VUR80DRAFT_8137 [Thermomyces stellatus]